MSIEIMGAYRLYKLGRMTGGFSEDLKVKERDLHVIPNEYAEMVNATKHINGLLYIKDEKATKRYFAGEGLDETKEYTDFEEIPAEPKKVEAPEPEEETESEIQIKARKSARLAELEKMDIEDLRDMHHQATGNHGKPNWGVKKLAAELNLLMV